MQMLEFVCPVCNGTHFGFLSGKGRTMVFTKDGESSAETDWAAYQMPLPVETFHCTICGTVPKMVPACKEVAVCV